MSHRLADRRQRHLCPQAQESPHCPIGGECTPFPGPRGSGSLFREAQLLDRGTGPEKPCSFHDPWLPCIYQWYIAPLPTNRLRWRHGWLHVRRAIGTQLTATGF